MNKKCVYQVGNNKKVNFNEVSESSPEISVKYEDMIYTVSNSAWCGIRPHISIHI